MVKIRKENPNQRVQRTRYRAALTGTLAGEEESEWRRSMNRGGFSWKRATGITRAKSRVSRATGIPWTKSGRQRKVGKMVTGGGCLVMILAGAAIPATIVLVLKLIG